MIINDAHKEFVKSDFATGDVVLYRNGRVGIVNLNPKLNATILENGLIGLDDIGADLTHIRSSNWDVMKVRRPAKSEECRLDAFKKEYGELIYKREEPEEMTLEEVCKALGKEIKVIE